MSPRVGQPTKKQLYAFTYKTLYLHKINANANNDEDISHFCKREKK